MKRGGGGGGKNIFVVGLKRGVCAHLLIAMRAAAQTNLVNSSEFIPLDPSQEPIFPPELLLQV